MTKPEEAWKKEPQDVYYEVYGQLGDPADEDIEEWGRSLAQAVLDEADVGFDDPLEGGGDMKCEDCTWNSGPYSVPCEKHSKLGDLRRRIEELGK